MKKNLSSVILDTAFRIIVPFTIVYGVYVLLHGGFGPGGGFQAGAVLAVGVVLSRLNQDEAASFNMSGKTALILAGVGTFLYGAVGLISVAAGGRFLEYSVLPLGLAEADLHAWGILGIEVGVTICVMATIIVIFDALNGREGGS